MTSESAAPPSTGSVGGPAEPPARNRPGGAPPSAFISAAAVSFTRGLSVVLTVIYGVLSASYFGAGVAKDCYLVAQAFPSLLSTLLMTGIYGLVLVALAEIGPSEGVRGQLRLVRRTLLQLGSILVTLSVAVSLYPRPVIALIAPGFRPEQLELSARILPITMFTMVGTVGFAVFRALYNSRHQFALPGFVNLLVGATALMTLILMVGRAGIFAQALGQLLGTLLSVIVLGGTAFLLKDPPGLPQEQRAPGPGRWHGLWRNFIPMCVGANFAQVNLLVDNAFASFLPAGSITQLGFASVIFTHAEFLTIFALAEVAFARFTAADRLGAGALEEELRLNLRYMLLLAAPIAWGCLTFGTPLARVLFERGQFGADSTLAVGRILACLGPEIVFMGYFACFWRILFARRRLKLLVWTSVLAMALNAVLDALLLDMLGVSGVALSTTCVTTVLALVLGRLVRREGLRIFAPGDWSFTFRVLAGATIMGAAVLAWTAAVEHTVGTATQAVRLFETAGGLALGAVVYSIALQVQGIRAVPEAMGRLARMAIDWRRG